VRRKTMEKDAGEDEQADDQKETKPKLLIIIFLLSYSKRICQKQNREEGKLAARTKQGRFGGLL
jgi:hypothetical protein